MKLPRVIPAGLKRLLPPIVGLIAVVLLGALLETLAFGWLRTTAPERARSLQRRHALLGEDGGSGNPYFRGHPLYGWMNRFSPAGSVSRGGLGFVPNRSDDTIAIEPGADVRIFVLGGSTVRGTPHPPEKSIPALVERRLERRYPREFNVVNAGVSGWFSVNETAFLTQEILPFFEPDAVIVLDGANDAKRSVRAGMMLKKHSGRFGFGQNPSLFDRHLRSYRRQFLAYNRRPGFVLNQWLHAMNLHRYLEPSRYFAADLLLGTLGEAPSHRPPLARYREFWRQFQVDPEVRERFWRRLDRTGSRDVLRRTIQGLTRSRRKRLQYHLGTAEEARFRRIVGDSPSLDRERIRALLRRPELRVLPAEVLADPPCRAVPVSADPYIAGVRSMAGALSGRKSKFLHALQPTLVRKKPRTNRERRLIHGAVSRSLFGSLRRTNYPRGTCWNQVFEVFYNRASSRLDALADRSRNPVRTMDLSDLFRRETETRFSDPNHYTVEAHREIARALTERLERMDLW